MTSRSFSTGIASLDEVLQGLRLGDNVVWQVDRLDDYVRFVQPFVDASLAAGRRCVYIRFADHEHVLAPREGIEVLEVDPAPGFDSFSREIHQIIEARGKGVFYVFDNLSDLLFDWATDELIANFFQFTCPYLYELDTITYFALTRGKHTHGVVARIRDTTQLLVDVFHAAGRLVIHPIKVWDRYTPTMFLPHLLTGESWSPIVYSGEAAAVSSRRARSPLEDIMNPMAPWNSVYNRLRIYYGTGPRVLEDQPEVAALKQELSRMLLGSHPEFDRLVDRYLTLDDLLEIRNRILGSGRIGGKAGGMLLARKILRSVKGPDGNDFSRFLEPHDSFFIGSDVFFTFLVNNNLFRLRLELSRDCNLSHAEFEDVEKGFLQGEFPPTILEQFRHMLEYFGQAPIIIRSSSLLEDSFGNSFAGKYRSEFCANQGSPRERLDAFTRAIKLVYASALNPNALSYRRKRGLIENDEQMAILVQRVSGSQYRDYFFPTLAGVAFSRNLYSWCDRIDPEQGMIRLVFGLGTRAVERVGGDYPRMIAVSQPNLRPEIGARVAKYSQRLVDLIDLTRNSLESIPVSDVLEGLDYPNLHLFVSILKDGYVVDPVSRLLDGPATDLVLTFNNLIRQVGLVKVLGNMLATLESCYERPIDTEFTASVDAQGQPRINLLQCRPLFLPGIVAGVRLPEGLPRDQVLFRSSRMIYGGVVRDMRYVVYIDPSRYSHLPDLAKKRLGRVVGRINQHRSIQTGRFMMMGPGRWGSSSIDLGVNVGYADIDHAAVLVEIAREESGQVPEVSYGTHFFQDLVEERMIYLPVYPDDPEAEFHQEFFHSTPSVLLEILPDAVEFKDVVRVLDVATATGGRNVHVLADPEKRTALCFLE